MAELYLLAMSGWIT